MNQTIETRWIALSERVYRMLLILYPADYRREYGALMAQIFRDVCRERYRSHGVIGVVWWWCKTMLDLAFTVIEQRRKVKFTMSKSTFIHLTGILLIWGGALGALAAFSQLQPGDHSGIYQAVLWLFSPSFLLVGLGCIGLGLRYDRGLGPAGQWALYLSGVGGLVMGVGLVGASIESALWNLWLGGGILHTLSLTVFGIVHVRKPALPIFRALPLQLAAGWLVLMLGGLRTNSETSNNLLAFLFFLGIGLVWLAIGLTVQRQSREMVPAAA